ncbi:BTAD domain-containing putative transcriptional regulator [Dactylosporangium sp. NPDC048998]|uniref:BTAD domain-containing putative transcriptional regulator n=1 Tax=Dactylosporangium sp. NPDC048998 TaxID=3363976 RepID=UPI0037168564
MRFGILGPLEVRDDAGAPVAVGGPKPRALLTRLLLEAGRVVAPERLGGESANALQAQVSRLRRALPGGPVEFTGGGYRIAVDPQDVDAHRFERLARDGRQLLAGGDFGTAAGVLREALDLWRGPALADLPDAATQAVRLEEARLAAAEDLVEAELALPEGTPVGPLRRLAAEHPFRERLRGQLMRALHAAGRTAEALAEFDEARRLLAAELGADPSAELLAVHLAILRAEPPHRPRGTLPAPLTRLVGREDELERLAGLRGARLVTLVGPGGAGKTRLAVEAAGRDGREVSFADLTRVEDGDLVPHAVAGALGLREGGSVVPRAPAADPVRSLAGALAGREVLLVLDNCEQALDATAGLVRALLGQCPDLAVLATSREPLGLTGEVLVPVGPLAPEPAARLFAERAAAVRAGFAVDDELAAAVARICALLDGLPLAIELAAARLRQLSVGELAERLAAYEHFAVLSRGDRTAAGRHRTLRAVVDWSWQLLGPEERALARRFTVFAGGATRPAVEAVCGAGEDLLADLVDRSLLSVRDGRYRMLETIQLYCRERLAEASEERRLRAAHAAFHLDLARRADPFLRRAEQLEWLDTLAAEHENLMAALRWSVAHDRDTAMRLIAALAAYWWLGGRRGEVAALAARVLDALPDGPPAGLEEEYVSCVVHAESLAGPRHRRRADAAMAALDRPLRHPFGAAVWGMSRVDTVTDGPSPVVLGGDPWNLALQRLGAALLAVLGGRPDDAALLDVLARFRALGERWGTAQALDWLAHLAGWRGEWPRAHELWAGALAALDELGAAQEAADVLCRRGDCRVRQGDLPGAEADYRRAAELGRRAGRPGTAPAELGLGEVARHRGDLAEAARRLDLALSYAHAGDLGAVYTRSSILTALARLAEARAADPLLDEARRGPLLDEARGRHDEALAAARAAPLAAGVADALEGHAGHAALTGHGPAAARLLGRAAALRGTTVTGDPDVARTAALTRDLLGEDAFAAAYSAALRA